MCFVEPFLYTRYLAECIVTLSAAQEASHLKDPLEECPCGGNEQEEDADSVRDTAGFAKSTFEAAGILNVLNQQVSADDETDDAGDYGASHADDHVRGYDDQEDECGR